MTMDDLPQQPVFLPPAEGPQVPAPPARPPSGRSSKILWIPAVISLVGACVVVVLCVAALVYGVGVILAARAPIENVLDTFMKDMAAKDTQSAYQLFSLSSHAHVSLLDLNAMVAGDKFVLFDGYRRLSVDNININFVNNASRDQPQGTVARVEGSIAYKNGTVGHFQAVLEKSGDVWELYSIYLDFPQIPQHPSTQTRVMGMKG